MLLLKFNSNYGNQYLLVKELDIKRSELLNELYKRSKAIGLYTTDIKHSDKTDIKYSDKTDIKHSDKADIKHSDKADMKLLKSQIMGEITIRAKLDKFIISKLFAMLDNIPINLNANDTKCLIHHACYLCLYKENMDKILEWISIHHYNNADILSYMNDCGTLNKKLLNKFLVHCMENDIDPLKLSIGKSMARRIILQMSSAIKTYREQLKVQLSSIAQDTTNICHSLKWKYLTNKKKQQIITNITNLILAL